MGEGRGHSPRFPPLLLATWAVPLSLPPHTQFCSPHLKTCGSQAVFCGWEWGCPPVLQSLIPPVLPLWLNWHCGVTGEAPNTFIGLIFLAALARADPSSTGEEERAGNIGGHYGKMWVMVCLGSSSKIVSCNSVPLSWHPFCNGYFSSRWGYPGPGCASREC